MDLDIEEHNYFQFLELINSQLLYIDGNKIVVLKPTINKNYQEKSKKELNANIVSMTELNYAKFCIYSEDNCINIYDSNSLDCKVILKGLPNLTKIQRIDIDYIACLTEKKDFFLLCEGNFKAFENENNIDKKHIIDIFAEEKKLIVAHETYLKEYNLIDRKGGTYSYNGALEIYQVIVKGEKLKKICVLNKRFEENINNENNGKIVCCFKNCFYVYKHK